MKISGELSGGARRARARGAPNEVLRRRRRTSRGRDRRLRRAVECIRADEHLASPLASRSTARELLRLSNAIEAEGCELGAIYHSHTRTAPYPSQTDINFAANWPGVEWIIVGLAGDRARGALLSDRGRQGATRSRSRCGDGRRAARLSGLRARLPAERALLRGVRDAARARPALASDGQRASAARARKIKPQYSEGALVKVARAAQPARGGVHRGAAARGGHPQHAAPLGGFDVPDCLVGRPARRAGAPESGAEAAREALRLGTRRWAPAGAG